MTAKSRNILSAAVALTLGGGFFIFFYLLNRSEGPSATGTSSSAVTTTVTAPQDPTHERVAMQEELRKNPGHAPILFRLAEIERMEGNYEAAIGYLRQIVDMDRTNADALLELGRALYESGDVEGARQETERLVEAHPDNADGLYNLGAIYANQGQFDRALQYWNQAVEVDPMSESGRNAERAMAQLQNAAPTHVDTADVARMLQ